MGSGASGGGAGSGGGKAYEGKRVPERDFTGKKGQSTLESHFGDHGGEFKTQEEYLEAARNFLEKVPTSTTESFVTRDGAYFRYDTSTNEFGIMNKYGQVSTYFKPNTGINYWVGELKKYIGE